LELDVVLACWRVGRNAVPTSYDKQGPQSK
jgi:hypothetical protein